MKMRKTEGSPSEKWGRQVCKHTLQTEVTEIKYPRKSPYSHVRARLARN